MESYDNAEGNLTALPRHVAIIMDGNGRWAQHRGLPRVAGHQAGIESVREVVKSSSKLGVEVLTLFAFSTENQNRPADEVELLMNLIVTCIDKELPELHQNKVNFRMIGNRSTLSDKVLQKIKMAEEVTATNAGLKLMVALNYSGKWDITNAAFKLCQQVEAGNIVSSQIGSDTLSQHLQLSGVIAPDLFIRTSGEKRLSNFLLWDLAYTELYFTETYWPDFRKPQFLQAIADFSKRQRRFGLTQEQVEQEIA